MSGLSIRSTCKTAMAASLILALLARVLFANGLLLHDHSDHGVHSHSVTLDDVREGDLRGAWHRHHDENRDDSNNDSDGDESGDSLFVFVNDPTNPMGIHCSSSSGVASIQHLSPKVLPRSMLPSDRTDASRFSAAARASAPALRPDCALDALLQSSHALLL